MHLTLAASAAALLALVVIGAWNSQTHDSQHEHPSHGNTETQAPQQIGQSAFAAISEIVARLQANPSTDWSSVSIDRLREHLVDMNELTLRSEVSVKVQDTSIQFTVSGDASTRRAIQTMVPAHAQTVGADTGWDIDTSLTPHGAAVSIDPGSADALQQLEALGFFGFMTLGAHHQVHHYRMALGHEH